MKARSGYIWLRIMVIGSCGRDNESYVSISNKCTDYLRHQRIRIDTSSVNNLSPFPVYFSCFLEQLGFQCFWVIFFSVRQIPFSQKLRERTKLKQSLENQDMRLLQSLFFPLKVFLSSLSITTPVYRGQEGFNCHYQLPLQWLIRYFFHKVQLRILYSQNKSEIFSLSTQLHQQISKQLQGGKIVFVKPLFSQIIKKLSANVFCNPKDSLLSSEQTANFPSPEPDKSSPRHPILFPHDQTL